MINSTNGFMNLLKVGVNGVYWHTMSILLKLEQFCFKNWWFLLSFFYRPLYICLILSPFWQLWLATILWYLVIAVYTIALLNIPIRSFDKWILAFILFFYSINNNLNLVMTLSGLFIELSNLAQTVEFQWFICISYCYIF